MKFFKTFLAALLAVVVGSMLLVMIGTMVLVGIGSSIGSSIQPVSSKSVLKLNLQTITDAPQNASFDNLDIFSMNKVSRTSLLATISAINAAAADDRIKGIYINFDEYANVSMSNLEEIRAALSKFKQSGKFILAYNENYGQADYYLASIADRVYMNPEGGFDWRGMSLRSMFYKGLLEKLEIEPIILRHGTFKAAVEPFMYDKMSPESRLQNQAVANSLWGGIVEAVSEARAIPVSSLQDWANTLAIDSSGAALERGLVDGLRYEDQVMDELAQMIKGWSREESTTSQAEIGEATYAQQPTVDKQVDAAKVEANEQEQNGGAADEAASSRKVKYGTDNRPKIVSFSDYAAQVMPTTKLSKNKIALIYADGSIVSGTGGSGDVGSVTIAKKLEDVRKDPNVKAVVFRVNSPGGSALASDVMWRELKLLQKEVPVIVSMGAYAASGGYYISCPADVIYANKSTITGSIGVFGLFGNVAKTFKNKLGITVDAVTTNQYSNLGSMFHTPDPVEMRYFMKSIEDVYTTFVEHVAEGRNMSYEAVDKIGEGRIWSGADAVDIGLVDGIGGLYDAIAVAADRAGISDDFRIWQVLDDPSGLTALLNSVMGSIRQKKEFDAMGEMFVHYNNLKSILNEQGVQARMPYLLEFE